MQANCLKMLNQFKQDIGIRVILVDMFEKMDYETYGNDQLEKIISEVAGDVWNQVNAISYGFLLAWRSLVMNLLEIQ